MKKFLIYSSILFKQLILLSSFIVFIVLAAYSTIDEYGKIALFFSFFLIFNIFTLMGLDRIIFDISVKNFKKKIVSFFIGHTFYCQILIFIISLSFIFIVNAFLYKTTLNIFLLLLLFILANFFYSISIILSQYFLGKKNYLLHNLCLPFYHNIFLLFFIFFNKSINFNEYVYLFCFGNFINFILALSMSKNFFKQIGFSLYIVKKNYRLKPNIFYFYNIILVLVANVDIIFLRFFSDNFNVGLYAFSTKFPAICTTFLVIINQFFLPDLLNTIKTSRIKFFQIYKKIIIFIFFIFFITFIIFSFFLESIVLKINNLYIDSIQIIWILFLAHFVNLLFGPNSLIILHKKKLIALIILFISLIFYIICISVLFHFFNMVGIAIAYFIFVLFFNVLNTQQLFIYLRKS